MVFALWPDINHDGLSQWFSVKNPLSFCGGNIRDMGLIPGWEGTLEEELATHSSIVAWRVPWAEEPGGLQSMGSQRVGHD